MKKALFSIFLSLFIISTTNLPTIYAQDYTQWELPEGAIARLGKGRINDMKYSPDGTVLAVATTIGTWLYDTRTYQERALLMPKRKGVEKIIFDPDGKTLACAENYKGITLWDVGARKLMKTFNDGSPVYRNMLFSPNGRTFARVGYKDIHLYDLVTGKSKHILKKHTDFITCLSISPDSQTLASGSKDQSICLWDITAGTHKQTLTGHPESVTSVSFSPDGSTLISVSEDTTIYLWDISTGERKKILADKGLITDQLDKPETVERAFFSPGDSILATVRLNSTIHLWDTTTGTHKRTFPSQDTDIKENDYRKKIEKVLFSPDNQTVVGLTRGGKIRLWGAVTGERKVCLKILVSS